MWEEPPAELNHVEVTEKAPAVKMLLSSLHILLLLLYCCLSDIECRVFRSLHFSYITYLSNKFFRLVFHIILLSMLCLQTAYLVERFITKIT